MYFAVRLEVYGSVSIFRGGLRGRPRFLCVENFASGRLLPPTGSLSAEQTGRLPAPHFRSSFRSCRYLDKPGARKLMAHRVPSRQCHRTTLRPQG